MFFFPRQGSRAFTGYFKSFKAKKKMCSNYVFFWRWNSLPWIMISVIGQTFKMDLNVLLIVRFLIQISCPLWGEHTSFSHTATRLAVFVLMLLLSFFFFFKIDFLSTWVVLLCWIKSNLWQDKCSYGWRKGKMERTGSVTIKWHGRKKNDKWGKY